MAALRPQAFSFDVAKTQSPTISPLILKMRAMTNRFFFQNIDAEFWPSEGG
jgi:hypothetical protein